MNNHTISGDKLATKSGKKLLVQVKFNAESIRDSELHLHPSKNNEWSPAVN